MYYWHVCVQVHACHGEPLWVLLGSNSGPLSLAPELSHRVHALMSSAGCQWVVLYKWWPFVLRRDRISVSACTPNCGGRFGLGHSRDTTLEKRIELWNRVKWKLQKHQFAEKRTRHLQSSFPPPIPQAAMSSVRGSRHRLSGILAGFPNANSSTMGSPILESPHCL